MAREAKDNFELSQFIIEGHLEYTIAPLRKKAASETDHRVLDELANMINQLQYKCDMRKKISNLVKTVGLSKEISSDLNSIKHLFSAHYYLCDVTDFDIARFTLYLILANKGVVNTFEKDYSDYFKKSLSVANKTASEARWTKHYETVKKALTIVELELDGTLTGLQHNEIAKWLRDKYRDQKGCNPFKDFSITILRKEIARFLTDKGLENKIRGHH